MNKEQAMSPAGGETFLQRSEKQRGSRADERRHHLLTVSQQLFIEHGFHGTGVAQIAAASGVKVGQIYRDFSSKEDIIAAIVEADLCSFLNEEELESAVERRDRAALRRWIASFLDIPEATDEDRLVPEIIAEAGRNARVAQILRRLDDRIRDRLLVAFKVLLDGADARYQARAEILAELVLTLGIGFCNRRLVAPDAALDEVSRTVWGYIERELDRIGATA